MLIELDGQFIPKTERHDNVKRIKRDSLSIIISVKEIMELF